MRSKIGAVTNWTTLHRPMALHGCKQILHLPLMNLSKEGSPFDALMIVFNPLPDTVGVFCVQRNMDTAGFARQEPLGAMLSPARAG